MKKMLLLLIMVVFVLFIIGCQAPKEEPVEAPAKEPAKESPAKESSQELSDLQVTACNTADEAGTCDTRLAEVGIVTKETCCGVLGKCC